MIDNGTELAIADPYRENILEKFGEIQPLFFSAAEHKIAKKQQPEDKENRHKDIRHKKCDRHTKCDPEHGIAYDPFHWISPNLFITRICICKGIVAQKVMDFTELSDPHDLLLSFSLFFFLLCFVFSSSMIYF